MWVLQVCGLAASLTISLRKKPPGSLTVEAFVETVWDQVRYGIRNSVMPGKNSSSKVRMVSLIRKGMMPL